MSSQVQYGIRLRTGLSYDEAVAAVTEALADQGFGVLTEIDVKSTLHEKLGVDFRRYVILGACNPHLADRALRAEVDVGLLLPCNVIVYEADDGVVVAAIDPRVLMGLVENPELESVGREVDLRLRAALDRLPR